MSLRQARSIPWVPGYQGLHSETTSLKQTQHLKNKQMKNQNQHNRLHLFPSLLPSPSLFLYWLVLLGVIPGSLCMLDRACSLAMSSALQFSSLLCSFNFLKVHVTFLLPFFAFLTPTGKLWEFLVLFVLWTYTELLSSFSSHTAPALIAYPPYMLFMAHILRLDWDATTFYSLRISYNMLIIVTFPVSPGPPAFLTTYFLLFPFHIHQVPFGLCI